MTRKLRSLTLTCIAARPFAALAQDVPPPAPPPAPAPAPVVARDLGLIPDGEERMYQVSGRIDLTTATQDQVNALVDVTLFQISPTSGFCLAAMTPGMAPSVLLFNGTDRVSGMSLFDADSGPDGLALAEGRRTFVRTTGPVNEMSFILSTLVGQTPTAAGDTAVIFVRVYPETTPDAMLDEVCGPFKTFPMAAPTPVMMPTMPPAPVVPPAPAMMPAPGAPAPAPVGQP